MGYLGPWVSWSEDVSFGLVILKLYPVRNFRNYGYIRIDFNMVESGCDVGKRHHRMYRIRLVSAVLLVSVRGQVLVKSMTFVVLLIANCKRVVSSGIGEQIHLFSLAKLFLLFSALKVLTLEGFIRQTRRVRQAQSQVWCIWLTINTLSI